MTAEASGSGSAGPGAGGSGSAVDPDAGLLAGRVAELVAGIVGQRWYGAHDRKVAGARIVDRAAIPAGAASVDGAGRGGSLRWSLLEVAFTDGEVATYQLVLDEATGEDAGSRPEVLRWMFPGLAVGQVRPLAGEQSNTSVAVDDATIVKLFRRVGPPGARNPDAEMVRALWEHGFGSVAEPVAEFTRGGRDLAAARRFLPAATSGWDLLLERAEVPDELYGLGEVTAHLHVALAEVFGDTPGAPQQWSAVMIAGLARAPLPDGLDATSRFAAVGALADAGRSIRIHGDYHLGQVLHEAGRWTVLDFEGEPARPRAERVAPSSALRDVAGMLRSFSYAAAVGDRPPSWEAGARQRFLDGYRSVDEVDRLLPGDPAVLLAAFELDKAVYEVGYERANRPDWEAIPLAAVRRLLR